MITTFFMNTEEIMQLSLSLVGFDSVPFDSQIYVEGNNIEKVLFAIDVGTAELLLARQLGCDCVIAHHPVGQKAVLEYHHILKKHIDQMMEAGIPKKEAEEAAQELIEQAEVASHSRNYDQVIEAARVLDMPFMNIHNPLDVLGRRIMQDTIKMKTNESSTVRDVIDALYALNEFARAKTRIELRLGKMTSRAGRIVVAHGAGTNGGYRIAKTYFKYIDTLIYIHISPQDLQRLKQEEHGTLIITGHIASDMVGINPFLEELERRGIGILKLTEL